MKKMLAMLLCLAMLWNLAIPAADAQGALFGEDIFYGADAGQTGMPMTCPPITVGDEQTTSPAEPEPFPDLPECSCGERHVWYCQRLAYLIGYCGKPAREIYALYRELPARDQSYILNYLKAYDAQRYLEVVARINALPESGGSATVDGTTVQASGIPQGSTVTMTAPSEELVAQAVTYAQTLNPEAEPLFSWDISVQDVAGADWQPGQTVWLELDQPGEKLHRYSQVFVIHVDDAGSSSVLPAHVTEEGKIAFETDGFSTFAGFTVDFEYDGVPYSIGGGESILLSSLFDALKMPLYAQNAVNVEFTDYTLISVEQQDGDWLLTSLKAFNTTELLTVTMNDGKVYEIKVTEPM